jgi:polygalacturonase
MIRKFFILAISLAILPGCTPRTSGMNDVRPTGGGGGAADTQTIQAAIDRCSSGSVRLLAGVYHTGAIRLHEHLTLILDPGATIIASDNPADFPIVNTRYEGVHQQAYASLFAAENAGDISIVGSGTIDGSGKAWWDRALDTAHPPAYPRPRLIEFLHCHDVAVRGIKLKNPPCWTIHPAFCNNVVVDDVTITAPPDSPNTDGVDPDSSTHVSVTHCTFDCGDDCVAIKSGKDAEGRAENLPSHGITISDCTMLHGIAGVGIGSEMSGGVFDVKVSHCTFTGTSIGIRVKTRRGRGGVVHDLSFSDLTMADVDETLELTVYFWEKNDQLPPAALSDETPTLRDVAFAHITTDRCKWAGKIDGLPEQPIAGVSLTDVKISSNQGMYLRYATGLKFKNVQIVTAIGPPFMVDHAEGTDVPATMP